MPFNGKRNILLNLPFSKNLPRNVKHIGVSYLKETNDGDETTYGDGRRTKQLFHEWRESQDESEISPFGVVPARARLHAPVRVTADEHKVTNINL